MHLYIIRRGDWLGKNTTIVDEENDETYFSTFREMEKCGVTFHKKKLSLLLSKYDIEEPEEECNDVRIYQMIRYPPKSAPPTYV